MLQELHCKCELKWQQLLKVAKSNYTYVSLVVLADVTFGGKVPARIYDLPTMVLYVLCVYPHAGFSAKKLSVPPPMQPRQKVIYLVYHVILVLVVRLLCVCFRNMSSISLSLSLSFA